MKKRIKSLTLIFIGLMVVLTSMAIVRSYKKEPLSAQKKAQQKAPQKIESENKLLAKDRKKITEKDRIEIIYPEVRWIPGILSQTPDYDIERFSVGIRDAAGEERVSDRMAIAIVRDGQVHFQVFEYKNWPVVYDGIINYNVALFNCDLNSLPAPLFDINLTEMESNSEEDRHIVGELRRVNPGIRIADGLDFTDPDQTYVFKDVSIICGPVSTNPSTQYQYPGRIFRGTGGSLGDVSGRPLINTFFVTWIQRDSEGREQCFGQIVTYNHETDIYEKQNEPMLLSKVRFNRSGSIIAEEIIQKDQDISSNNTTVVLAMTKRTEILLSDGTIKSDIAEFRAIPMDPVSVEYEYTLGSRYFREYYESGNILSSVSICMKRNVVTTRPLSAETSIDILLTFRSNHVKVLNFNYDLGTSFTSTSFILPTDNIRIIRGDPPIIRNENSISSRPIVLYTFIDYNRPVSERKPKIRIETLERFLLADINPPYIEGRSYDTFNPRITITPLGPVFLTFEGKKKLTLNGREVFYTTIFGKAIRGSTSGDSRNLSFYFPFSEGEPKKRINKKVLSHNTPFGDLVTSLYLQGNIGENPERFMYVEDNTRCMFYTGREVLHNVRVRQTQDPARPGEVNISWEYIPTITTEGMWHHVYIVDEEGIRYQRFSDTTNLSIPAGTLGFIRKQYAVIISSSNNPRVSQMMSEPFVFTLDIDDRDSDGDGLLNYLERINGTDPFNRDTDADGLTDGQERPGMGTGTDPLRPDTDGDGLTDGAELARMPPTDPRNSDTDGDNLSDSEEISVYLTSPNTLDPINFARVGGVSISASSRFNDGYHENNVADGGLNDDTHPPNQEWATAGGRAGSWVQINFPRPVPIKRLRIYDRRNVLDNVSRFNVILTGDGAPRTITGLGPLENGDLSRPAAPFEYIIDTVFRASSIRIEVTDVSAETLNIGFAEVEVYNI